MMGSLSDSRRNARLLALGLLIGLIAYWAGSRWGPRHADSAEAVLQGQRPPAAQSFSGEEAENVRIYQQSAPAVANIITRAIEYNFFGAFPSEGAGSGFVLDTRGYVLTNFHVVQGAQQIEVTLGDKTKSRFQAKFVGGDMRNDVALLKIDPGNTKLVALPLGDASVLHVGQRVLAIGNPFGQFQSTLTTGVVSALGRTVQTGDNTLIDAAIQTDAAINRGNSGGPLLNSRGEVIGVNTAIYTPTGVTAGIGFAIPINTARRIAEDLIREGRVRRAILGIEGVVELFPNLAEALELPVKSGLMLQRVTPGGPADRAGIRGGDQRIVVGLQYMLIGGDVIVEFDGQPIERFFDLNVQLNRKRPGDTVTLTIYRGRQKINVKVTLGEG
jgi:putative serine protease PepD